MDTKNILFVCHADQDFSSLNAYVKLLSASYAGQHDVIILMPDSPRGYEEIQQKNKELLRQTILSGFSALELHTEINIDFISEKNGALDIIRQALSNNYEMIIKIKDGGGSGKQKGFRAIDMNLLRKCPLPLWIVDKKEMNDKPDIVTAIDPFAEEQAGLDLNFKLLEKSQKLCEIVGGKHTVISCWDFSYEKTLRESPLMRTDDSEVDEILKSTEAEHRAAVDKILEEAGVTPDNIAIERGKAQDAIPQYVESNEIDILIMGTVARTGIPGFIIGNTAENILQQISCDLLAFKPDGFVSPVKKS